MAWIKSTIGNAASSADYAADTGALQLWETAIDGLSAGDYESEIITNIVDDLSCTSFLNGSLKNLWIHGDIIGYSKREITTATDGLDILFFSDADIGDITIEDLILDGTNQKSTEHGIYGQASAASGTLTLNRVWCKNNGQYSILVGNSYLATNYNCNSCLFTDSASHGHYVAVSTAGPFTTTSKNCAFINTGSRGTEVANNANCTRRYYNCIALGSPTNDFSKDSLTDTTLDSCVSENNSALWAGHTSVTNCVTGQTDINSYFVDPSNMDYNILHNDFTNWGIRANKGMTPSFDFGSVARTNGTIGPYEYIWARTATYIGPE